MATGNLSYLSVIIFLNQGPDLILLRMELNLLKSLTMESAKE